jgi:4-hydroxybenzoate polyprenyltransferase
MILIVVAHHGTPDAGFMLRAFGVILASQVAVGALNDYHDRERDAISQPDKPIPSGLVLPVVGLGLTVVALAVLLPLAATFGPASLGLVILATASGVAYDLWLKPTPFGVLAYLVSFLTLVTWIWEIAGRFTGLFLLVYPAGTLALLSAHLANSYPDLETDRARGEIELTVLLGPDWTLRVVFLSYALVELAGVATAIARGRFAALALLAAGAVLGVVAWLLGRDAPRRPALRDRLFRLIATGIGIIAIGCLLAINPGRAIQGG